MTEQLKEYPTDRIVAIAEDQGVVDASTQAVRAADVGSVEVEVIRPSEQDESTTDEDDAGDGLLATARRLFGDETPHLERFAAALEQGASILLVTVPDADDLGDDEHARVKQAIGDALVDAGAAEVTYFGSWAIEQLGHRA